MSRNRNEPVPVVITCHRCLEFGVISDLLNSVPLLTPRRQWCRIKWMCSIVSHRWRQDSMPQVWPSPVPTVEQIKVRRGYSPDNACGRVGVENGGTAPIEDSGIVGSLVGRIVQGGLEQVVGSERGGVRTRRAAAPVRLHLGGHRGSSAQQQMVREWWGARVGDRFAYKWTETLLPRRKFDDAGHLTTTIYGRFDRERDIMWTWREIMWPGWENRFRQ